MSYTIDVYRKDAPVQRNIINFGAFVTMFPQLIAGPIVKYKSVAAELDQRTHTVEKFAEGACRFTVGLAKKVLLANAVGALWEQSLAAQGAGTLTVAGGWLGLLALTSWFREYLYIPLGGNRGGTAKTLRNILIVWFCTGFWHGASWNFILWGLYFALWLVLEKYVLRSVLTRTPAWIRHFYTLVVVFVGWGIFAMEDLSVCGGYLKACFGGAPLWSAGDGYTLKSYAVSLAVLTVAATPLGKNAWYRLPERARRVLTPVLMMAGLLLCTAYLVDGSYNPFLYFRF